MPTFGGPYGGPFGTATGLIRFEAAKAFSDYLTTLIPGLLGKIKVWHQTANALVTCDTLPGLVLLPQRLEFFPWQEDHVWGEGTAYDLLEVGVLQGVWELRLLATTAFEREAIEDLVIDAFNQREGAPGTIVTVLPEVTVKGVVTGYNAPVTFVLDGEMWHEEYVFSEKRWSFMDLKVNIPVLALRGPVYDIETLKLALTHDLSSDIPTEEVIINSDGTITPVIV